VPVQTPIDPRVPSDGKVPWFNGKEQSAWEKKARCNAPWSVVNDPEIGALNTGILCDGLRAVDIDVDDTNAAREIERIAVEMLGSAPVRRRSNSPRCAMLYRAQTGEPKKRGPIGSTSGKVEILGHGQQLVSFGMHKSGVPYQWDRSPVASHRDTLLPVSEDALTAFLTRCAPLVGVNPASIQPPRPEPVSAPSLGPLTPQRAPTEHERNTFLDSLGKHSAKVTAAQGGGRNDALNAQAGPIYEMVAAGWGSDAETATKFEEACDHNGLIRDDGIAAFRKTLNSARKKGFSQPRAPLPVVPLVDVSGFVNGKGQNNMFAPNGNRTVHLENMSRIEAKPIHWLWRTFIPAGQFTLLAGQGGAGKSTLCFDLAARISVGGVWPDGSRCPGVGNVLIYSAEDDVATTIKPRLMAAGADISRIGRIKETRDESGNALPFNPATDMQALHDAIKEIPGGAAMIIVDPIVSFVEGDMNKANEVRRSLQPLVDLAETTGTAIIGITHMAKYTQGRVVAERALGSRAFTDLARMVLIAAKDEETDQRVFTRAKSNNTIDTGGFSYTIAPTTVYENGTPIETTRIEWGDALTGSSREILRDIEAVEEDDGGKKGNAAQHFLRAELAAGPCLAKELIARAKQEHDISEKTLRRAQKQINVFTHRNGYGGPWYWSLPIAEGVVEHWRTSAQ
jgi:hypothetical protein